MKITKDEQEFFKANRSFIMPILEKRKADYIANLIAEEDDDKSKVLKMWIKEFEMWETLIKNIGNLKEKKKTDAQEFTGV